MKFSLPPNRWLALAGLCALGCSGFCCDARGGETFALESLGGRAGFPVSSIAAGFKEAEGFADFQLPWRWDLGQDWHLEPRLDSSLGWLADARVNAIMATLGPTLVLGWRHLPLTFEAGVSPTYLSRYNFATKNLGFPLQFTSHAGLNWDFVPHFRVSYRFQHMSNAGLSGDNPGLNMHLVSLSYVF